jgi:hypothetical protein
MKTQNPFATRLFLCPTCDQPHDGVNNLPSLPDDRAEEVDSVHCYTCRYGLHIGDRCVSPHEIRHFALMGAMACAWLGTAAACVLIVLWVKGML